MPAICAAAVAAVVAIAAAAALAPSVLPPAHADGPEPGTLAFRFGELGRDPGEFHDLGPVAVGPDGKIYASDRGRIQVFHANGTLDRVWNVGNITTYPFNDMAVGPDGKIYCTSSSSVIAFDPNGTQIPGGIGGVAGPYYIAVGPDGKIYLSSESYEIRVFHPNGTSAFRFGELGHDDGEISKRYADVAVGPDGKIYVADGGIQVYHPNGTFAFRIQLGGLFDSGIYGIYRIAVGPSGEFFAGGGLYYPNGTRAYYGGHLGHFDFGPTGLLVLGKSSSVSVLYGIEPTDEWLPSSLYEPPPDRGGGQGGGSGYMPPAAPPGPPVAGSRFAFEIGSYGSGPGEFRWPDNVAFGPGGIIAVSDWGNNRVNVFHPNGTFAHAFGSSGHGPGEFNRPFGIAFGPNGLLAVTDVGNHRVQFFYIE